MKMIRWGIVGPGKIARKFARTIARLPQCEIIAVCGTSMEKAQAFADEFGIAQAFCDNHQMATSDEIDAVYIATPHAFHKSCAEIHIKAGKHILCEKPLCVNARQAEQLQELAQKHQVFLMEAMWTQFLPSLNKAKELVQSGAIGEICGLHGSLCALVPTDCARMYRNDLAGGALLDTGIYPLQFAQAILGDPLNIFALGKVQGDVDHRVEMLLRYENNVIATLRTAMDHREPRDAYIFGTKGQIRIPTLIGANEVYLGIGKEPEICYECACLGEGFEEEILEVCRCIRAGKTQSDIHPMTNTITVLKQMDEVRRQIGLRYGADDE